MNKLHVEITGKGPPLVLLHGWAMHGGIFAPLTEALRERRTLHVVDLPGHGHSRDCTVSLQPQACAEAILAAIGILAVVVKLSWVDDDERPLPPDQVRAIMRKAGQPLPEGGAT